MSLIKPLWYTPLNLGLPINNGIVGAWIDSENAPALGSLHDFSENGNHGTLIGDTHSVPGLHGSALSFDGDNDAVDVVKPIVGTELTIVIWAKSTGPGSYNGNDGYFIGDSTDAANFYFRRQGLQTNLVELGMGDAGSIVGIASPVDKWEFYVLRHFSDGVYELWVNGILQGSDTSSNFNGFSSNLYLGNRQDLLRDFDGQISSVLIYNRILSASEISSLYRDIFQGWRRQPLELIVAATSAGGAPPVEDIVVLRRRIEAA